MREPVLGHVEVEVGQVRDEELLERADRAREGVGVVRRAHLGEVRSGKRLGNFSTRWRWRKGGASAAPRLDDRSPTAFKVQGPVRVGER